MIPGLFCATLYNLVKVNSGPTMAMQCNSSEEAKMAWAIDRVRMALQWQVVDSTIMAQVLSTNKLNTATNPSPNPTLECFPLKQK